VQSHTTASKIASARSYQSVTQQVAGVSGGTNPNVKGSSSRMNRYLVDGLDMTDPVTNTFSANINFDSIASIQMLTGGMEAQYNALGGVINVTSFGGSDDFSLDASMYGNHYLLSAPRNYGSTTVDGFRPWNTQPPTPTQSAQGNINLGGPLVKEKLWFGLSYQFSDNIASTPAAPPLNVPAPGNRRISHLTRGKFNWAPDANNKLLLSFLADPAAINYSGNDAAGAMRRTPLAAIRQNQGSFPMGVFEWNHTINESMSTRTLVGVQRQLIEVGPQAILGTVAPSDINPMFVERSYDATRPMHTNSDDATIWYNNNTHNIDFRNKVTADASLSFRGNAMGSHDAMVGLQTLLSLRTFESRIMGGKWYTDKGGGPLEAGLCNEATGKGCFELREQSNYSEKQSGGTIGVFAQDRWKALPWLMVLPGIRFDYGQALTDDGTVAANKFGIGPRLGLVFDVTRDQKTIVTAFYGRSNEVFSLLSASTATPSPVTTIYRFNQGTKGWDPYQTTGGAGSIVVDSKNMSPPTADQVTLSLRREIGKGVAGSVEYTFKHLSNLWDTQEINIVKDPSGMRDVTYLNGEPQSISLLTTRPENYAQYQGIDFVVEGSPAANWEFYGAYTLSWKYGTSVSMLNDSPVGVGLPPAAAPSSTMFDNPRQTPFYQGYLPGDIRHQIKASFAYSLGEFSVGPNISYNAGGVLSKLHLSQDSGNVLRTPYGMQAERPNDPESWAELRVPPVLSVDVRASYDLHSLVGHHLIFIADVFNALNLSSATLVENRVQNESSYFVVAQRQTPLRVQVGLRFAY
jgi:hypothetical protein